MRYLKKLCEIYFKYDSKGNIVFLPWGILGKCYFLSSEDDKDKICSSMARYYLITTPLIFFPIAFFGWKGLGLVLFLLIPHFFIWDSKTKRYIEGLQQASEKKDFKFILLFQYGNRWKKYVDKEDIEEWEAYRKKIRKAYFICEIRSVRLKQ